MKLLIIVPNRIENYIAKFPAVRNNAYKYFNYDNRVVDEYVDRHDQKSAYKDPDDFTNIEYASLVSNARTRVNPILMKYSKSVAYEDALTMAIKDFNRGMFDGKVNADKFQVLLGGMNTTVLAKKKKPEESKKVPFRTLKDLGLKLKDIPHKMVVPKQQKAPHLVKEKGKVVVNK